MYQLSWSRREVLIETLSPGFSFHRGDARGEALGVFPRWVGACTAALVIVSSAGLLKHSSSAGLLKHSSSAGLPKVSTSGFFCGAGTAAFLLQPVVALGLRDGGRIVNFGVALPLAALV